MNEPGRHGRDTVRPRHGENYILIAMPNVNRGAAYRAVVSEAAYDTVLVRDGEEARQELARRGPPALMILDLSLPKVDGFELLREVRKKSSRAQTAAIVVSGHAPIRAVARRLAESLGIAKVLPFDVDRTALREAIELALRENLPARGIDPPQSSVQTEIVEPIVGMEDLLQTVVVEAGRRFRVPMVLVYVKMGEQELVKGFAAFSDLANVTGAAQAWTFLRQVAAGSDPLIVPDVTNYPALLEAVPSGLSVIRGFAGTPLGAAHADITGTLCLMDTKPLKMDAAELDLLDSLGRELSRDLARHVTHGHHASATPPVTTPPDLDDLQRLASVDPLTGLANRRGGGEDIGAEISRARRQNSALSCVLLDVDHFKDVNDTFGHQAGDHVLREISSLLRRTVRAYDILIRWGGEEFLVILPGVELEQARKLAERIRNAVESLPLAGIGGVTVSAGVAALGTDYSFEAMFETADRRLYSAKASGRNAVA
jgi:diguanylate cyclase (GGDEF)-like protein